MIELVSGDPFPILGRRPLAVASSVMQTQVRGRTRDAKQTGEEGAYGRTESYKYNVDYNYGRAREGRRPSAQ